MANLALFPKSEVDRVLTGIRSLLACFNGKNRCVLPSTRGLRIPMRLLGVWLQPPNKFGQYDWLLQRAWRNKLALAGIDPERIELLDEKKFWTAVQRIEENKEQQERKRAQLRQRKQREAVCVSWGRTLAKEEMRYIPDSARPTSGEELYRQQKLNNEGLMNRARFNAHRR
jgi:hypothetical protein